MKKGHLLDLVLFLLALEMLFCNLGSTSNSQNFHFFSIPSEGGGGIGIQILPKVLFLIFRKSQKVSKLYLYPFKSARQYLKRRAKMTPLAVNKWDNDSNIFFLVPMINVNFLSYVLWDHFDVYTNRIISIPKLSCLPQTVFYLSRVTPVLFQKLPFAGELF